MIASSGSHTISCAPNHENGHIANAYVKEMERLYYADSYLAEFTARVVAARETPDGPAVALDCTAFYPTGGGQPDDRGEIAGIPVCAVEEGRDGEVWHYLTAGPAPGGKVKARLDWQRRFDLMQQHTGQHLLSAAFLCAAEAETVGFHLTEENLQIDLDRPVTPEQVAAAEDLANRIIREDRDVSCCFIGPEEASRIPWRKPPAREGPIRLVTVESFDYSPCGGTHVRHTSELGLIKVTGLDRVRNGSRVSFLCGGRAIGDYRNKLSIVDRLVRELHTPAGELEAAAIRLREQLAQAEHQIGELRETLLAWEAERLRRDGALLIIQVYPGRPLDELRLLAARLTAQGDMAILARTEENQAQLVLARPTGDGLDLAATLRTALAPYGGKGGGTPAFAQGGLAADNLPQVLTELQRLIRSCSA